MSRYWQFKLNQIWVARNMKRIGDSKEGLRSRLPVAVGHERYQRVPALNINSCPDHRSERLEHLKMLNSSNTRGTEESNTIKKAKVKWWRSLKCMKTNFIATFLVAWLQALDPNSLRDVSWAPRKFSNANSLESRCLLSLLLRIHLARLWLVT